MQHLNAGCSDSVYSTPAVNPPTESMPWNHQWKMDKIRNQTLKGKITKQNSEMFPLHRRPRQR
jgi:hypothetical protein